MANSLPLPRPQAARATTPRLPAIRRERLVLLALALVVLLLSGWPALRLLIEAVAPGGTLSAGTAGKVLGDLATWRAALRSLDAALFSTLLALVLGTAMALLVAATDMRCRGLLVFAFILPLMIPPQITALSWVQMAGPASPLLGALGIAPAPGSGNPMHSRGGIILLLAVQHAPLVFITVRGALRRFSMDLLEAATLAGAGRLQLLRHILLPLLRPALVAGAALAFVSAIGNFGIAALLGIPAGYTLLPVLIYRKLASFGPAVLGEVAVLAVLTGAIALAGVWAQARFSPLRDSVIEADMRRPLHMPLGRWRLPVEIGVWLLLAAIAILPLMALLAAALAPAYGVRLSFATATAEHFSQLLHAQDAVHRAFVNSTVLAGTAALALALFGLPLGYFIAWRRSTATRLLAMLVELPYALPGVVLAVACIMVFLRPLPILGIALHGSLWVILIAYLARFMTLGLRPIRAGFAQLDPMIDEAAQLDGAGLGTRLRLVVLPLLAPLAAAGGILVFMTAFNELTVSALLWSAGSETLGVMVFNLDDSGESNLAAALAVLCVAAIVLLMLAAQAVDRRFRLGILPWAG